MKKHLFVVLALLAAAFAAQAAPIGKNEALRKAQAVAGKRGKNIHTEPVYKAPRKGGMEEGTAGYYVFDIDGGAGFVIIAGDDAVTTSDGLLGITDRGSFDRENIPDNFKAWLEACAAEMEAVGKTGTAYAPDVHVEITPMITTKWNQDDPYNSLCPTYAWQGSTEHYYTGCTNTAMAQLMRYNKWPQDNTVTIPEHFEQPALPPTTFDWDKMKDSYSGNYTDEERTAVAKLMYYCAQSTKSNYRYNGTGASLLNAAIAMKTYFGYDSNLKYVERRMFSIADWDGIIYGELAAGRPVLYGGNSSSVGHAFVCDGYRDALYHINWGWGGYCDGYFRLPVLNPSGSGIGGSSTEDGYSMNQQALIGIQKPTGNAEEPVYLSSYSVAIDGTSVSFSYYNMNDVTATFWAGCEIVNVADGTNSILWKGRTAELQPNYGYSAYGDDLRKYNLHVGEYNLYPVSCEQNETELKRCGSPTLYVTAYVADNGSITLVKHPVSDLKVTEFNFAGNKIATASQEIQITVNNSGDEFYAPVYLFVKASGNTDYLKANYTGVSVEAGGEETVSLYFTPETEGLYSVKLTYDEDGAYAIGETSVDIAKAPTAKSNLTEVVSLTMSADIANTMTMTVRNDGADDYICPIVAYLYKDKADGTGAYSYVETASVYQPIPKGESSKLLFTFTTDMIPGNKYAVQVFCYEYFSDSEPEMRIARSFFTAIETGIEDVVTDGTTGTDAPYYTLEGVKVDKPAGKGLYIHNGKKVIIR